MGETTRSKELSEKSVEELADYFDRTDTSELPLEDATEVKIERPELEQISIRLPKEDLAELKRRAARIGVGYTTLLRMILREHLRSPLRRP
jgi:predicted DNA binding CopG/RHH family protein